MLSLRQSYYIKFFKREEVNFVCGHWENMNIINDK